MTLAGSPILPQASMGDPRRFDHFADLIAERWPDRSVLIADVAGGHGQLNAALYRLGYRGVVTFDKRRGRWKPPGRHYRWGVFTGTEPEPFDVIVAMHPDAATDLSMDVAIRRQVPFAVVPCCAYPSVWPFGGGDYGAWLAHLTRHAEASGYAVRSVDLPIKGRATVLIGANS